MGKSGQLSFGNDNILRTILLIDFFSVFEMLTLTRNDILLTIITIIHINIHQSGDVSNP